ncbi:MAG: endonuclease MutS2, partial [bacterium]
MDFSTREALEFPQLLTILQGYGESRYAQERIKNLQPLSSVEEITRELQRVEEMRYLQRRSGGFPGGGLRDLEPLIFRAKAQGSRLDADELWGIVLNLRVHSQVRKLLDLERPHLPHISHLARNLTPLPALEEAIARAIHPDGTVKDNASSQLQRIRKEIGALQETIRERLNGIIVKWSRIGALREPTFTIREGRYVLPIRSDAMGKVKGIIHDRSSTGGTLFLEPAALIDLGNDLRSWELAERDEIERILKELTGKVRENLPQLEENYQIMGELDLLWAKAQLAERWGGVSPLIKEGLPLRLVGCRHPLLFLSGDRPVVPLDLELGTKYTTLVISGPNAGGKTVAIKTVGLLCLMALCGIP